VEPLFLQIFNMSVTAAYVIAAVLLIRLLLKKAPKKYSYVLWAAVLFRLVCPVSITSGFSLFNAPPFDMTVAQQNSEAALSYVPADIGLMDTPGMTVGIKAVNAYISDKLPSAAPTASVNPLQVWIMLGAIAWCVGVGALLIYGIVAYIRLKRRMATAVRLSERVYESDQIRSPFILGFIKPVIYIPFGLSEQERSYILQHEACHLRRKDHLIKPLAFIVLAVHWFNPLVWVAFIMMAKDMEMSCDEKVLTESGTGIAKEYCTSLLAFAANRRFPAAGPLAFGETGIRERINNVLRFKKPSKRAVVCSAIACTVALAICTTNPSVSGALEGMGAVNGNGQEAANSLANLAMRNTAELYGHYIFDKQLYMNPLSSFLAMDGFKEYYTLTENSLIITNEAGNQQEIAVAYEPSPLDEEEFSSSFMLAIGDLPSIAGYKQRYQYELTASEAAPGYRLYLLDDEIWLAKIQKDAANTQKNAYIWSIYRISKLPAAVSIRGTQDGVDAFLALNKDFQSGYDSDQCYNITPQLIEQNSDYTIFKYGASAASFLLYEGEIYPLGEWFGGNGVTSMALADMDSDGHSELFVTYSWGSGMHRSQVAYFNPASKQIQQVQYMHLNGDMALAANGDGGLSLYSAVLSNGTDFAHFDIAGQAFISNIVYADGQISINPPTIG
jgi:beta-lactamase regulating signal transducer with metallopeptidase domain